MKILNGDIVDSDGIGSSRNQASIKQSRLRRLSGTFGLVCTTHIHSWDHPDKPPVPESLSGLLDFASGSSFRPPALCVMPT